MNDLEIENKSCAAHDLNLVVRKALDQQQIVRDLVVACKKIATHFHKCDIEASAVDKEIKVYVQEKRLPLNEDQLGYWKNKTKDYPNLATLARQYLSAPAISVPSERVFSGAGLIYKPQRRRLKGETIEKLLFLKFNLVQLKFNY